jgi:hypothetical protein
VNPQKPLPLFFAFPDGVLNYVCAECDALCCRGQGLGGSLNREMGFLLKQYPELSTMANLRQRDLMDIHTPGGCCFFLRPDNLCQIETEHGRSRKPGVCLIFPFNRFHLLAGTVVISPHFMCTLRVEVPARPGVVTGTHAVIEATITESAMLDAKYADWYLRPVKVPRRQNEKQMLEREAAFRNDCGEALARDRFFDFLGLHSENSKQITRSVRRASQLMAWGTPSKSSQRDSIDDVLLTLASSLRIDLLDLPSEQILTTLALAERLVRRVFSISPVPPKPQAIWSVINQSLPLLRLLSYGDQTVAMKAKKKTAPFGHPELVFASFLAMRDIPSIGVAKGLEKGFQRLSYAADRAVLAHFIAEQIR